MTLETKHFRATREAGNGARPSIALVLGGGGARGLGHIVALEVFDELGIKPDVIAGTSIGAMFGAAYASGLSAEQVRNHVRELMARRKHLLSKIVTTRGAPLHKVLGALQLRSAFLKANAVCELVMPPEIGQSFDDLSVPLHVVATDFHKQSEVVFRDGPLHPAIAASMSIPGIFSPVEIGSRTLVDGGLVNPLPFDVVSEMADIVVAVDVSGGVEPRASDKAPSAVTTLVKSLQIMQRAIVREKLKSQQPDILVELDVGQFHALDFLKFEKILVAATKAKEELRAKLVRVLGAQTLATSDDVAAAKRDDIARHRPTARAGRARLADRLTGS